MAKIDEIEQVDYLLDALADIANAIEMLEDCDCKQEMADLQHVALKLLKKKDKLIAIIAKQGKDTTTKSGKTD